MGRRLREEEVMTIQVLHERGCSNREIARQLGVDEKAVRYRLARWALGAADGRADKPFLAEALHEVIAHWLERAATRRGVNLQVLHEYLVAEHGYRGSAKSVQRYVRAKFPPPKVRTRRRVETPPGAQGQVDWGEFPGVVVGGERVDLHAFHLVLSHSRMEAIVWSERADQLAWLHVHNEALRRLDGVPAVLRVDNVKTAVARGAGPWGTLNESYRCYAKGVRFHIDAARPRTPQDKGKVERRIGVHKQGFDPRQRAWDDVEQLQAWTDGEVARRAERRICPITGESVQTSYEAEKPHLGRLPMRLPEPFDLVQRRRVGLDATVRFEGRTYSVPFPYAQREVEVRGCARVVQLWADGKVLCEHPRRTRGRLLIDPRHYEGPSTDRIEAPTRLGKMGRRLEEIAAMVPEQRPLDLYAALAEVAR
ncbi:MAG: IS21 family transposase [Myxococcales bacterium]|nr:IS21 family transposase [Myxococcales bacterium]